jgi:hypothetical protein
MARRYSPYGRGAQIFQKSRRPRTKFSRHSNLAPEIVTPLYYGGWKFMHWRSNSRIRTGYCTLPLRHDLIQLSLIQSLIPTYHVRLPLPVSFLNHHDVCLSQLQSLKQTGTTFIVTFLRVVLYGWETWSRVKVWTQIPRMYDKFSTTLPITHLWTWKYREIFQIFKISRGFLGKLAILQ